RKHFFDGTWWQVYDFVDFVVANVADDWRGILVQELNKRLQNENSAYRVIGSQLLEITDGHEISELETAIEETTPLVRVHLTQAMALLSDRTSPDFRNSIKEAISAVEATCQWISGKKGATLADCLRALKTSGPMHPAFEQALTKL